MCSKIGFTLLVLFGLVSFNTASQCLAAESDSFEQTKQSIFSIIDTGDYAKAESAITRLSSDFSGQQGLPETLYWLAVRYEWSSRPGEAKRLYEQVIKNYPGNTWTQKARLGIARADVISLVSSQNYIGAKEAIDKLSVDFSGSPDLPEALYWIVPRYEWQNKYDEAKSICQQIVDKYPDSPYFTKAKMGISREGVMSLIILQNHDSAKAAVDKMIADFSGNPDLPESLFGIAERYRWLNRFEDEKYVYQQIIIQHIDDQSVHKAAVLIARSNVMSLIVSENHDKAMELLDKMVVDFSGNPDLPQAVFAIGEMWYEEGMKKEGHKSNTNVMDYFEKAKAAFDIALGKFPESGFVSDAQYFRSVCHQQLGDSNSAVQGYEALLNRWPDYKYAWSVHYGLGTCYQKLKESGAVAELLADIRTEQAFKSLIENYPDHGLNDQASFTLARINFKKSNWAEAAKYYEVYLGINEQTQKTRPFKVVCNLASCYEKMGDLDHSVEVYTSFLAKYPACPGADVVKEQLNQLLLRKNGAQVSK